MDIVSRKNEQLAHYEGNSMMSNDEGIKTFQTRSSFSEKQADMPSTPKRSVTPRSMHRNLALQDTIKYMTIYDKKGMESPYDSSEVSSIATIKTETKQWSL